MSKRQRYRHSVSICRARTEDGDAGDWTETYPIAYAKTQRHWTTDTPYSKVDMVPSKSPVEALAATGEVSEKNELIFPSAVVCAVAAADTAAAISSSIAVDQVDPDHL